ncbi:MAG: hypothetical protein R6V84_07470 [Desulfobacterales bacterium]
MDRESKDLVCSGPQPGPKRTEAGMAAWGVGAAAALIALLSACSWYAPYTVAAVSESQTARCQYLGTAAAIADMGAPQVNPRFRCDAEHRVLRQAEMMAATHVVWLGNYPFAAAAAAYRCPDR